MKCPFTSFYRVKERGKYISKTGKRNLIAYFRKGRDTITKKKIWCWPTIYE
jgi:hypothetical protein